MTPKAMNALTKFEAWAERMLEGGFARLFRSRLHRAELAEQLLRALEDGRSIGADGIQLAPDNYQVLLNADDYAQLVDRQSRTEIEQTLIGYLIKIAQQSDLALARRPTVRLYPSDHLSPRQVQVQAHLSITASTLVKTQKISVHQLSETPTQEEPLTCYLLIEQQRFTLTISPINLGRSLDNDIFIEHPRVSRHHAQLRQRKGRWWLIDLSSANGTLVNGRPVSEAILQSGDIISLADIEICFESQETQNKEQGECQKKL